MRPQVARLISPPSECLYQVELSRQRYSFSYFRWRWRHGKVFCSRSMVGMLQFSTSYSEAYRISLVSFQGTHCWQQVFFYHISYIRDGAWRLQLDSLKMTTCNRNIRKKVWAGGYWPTSLASQCWYTSNVGAQNVICVLRLKSCEDTERTLMVLLCMQRPSIIMCTESIIQTTIAKQQRQRCRRRRYKAT